MTVSLGLDDSQRALSVRAPNRPAWMLAIRLPELGGKCLVATCLESAIYGKLAPRNQSDGPCHSKNLKVAIEYGRCARKLIRAASLHSKIASVIGDSYDSASGLPTGLEASIRARFKLQSEPGSFTKAKPFVACLLFALKHQSPWAWASSATVRPLTLSSSFAGPAGAAGSRLLRASNSVRSFAARMLVLSSAA